MNNIGILRFQQPDVIPFGQIQIKIYALDDHFRALMNGPYDPSNEHAIVVGVDRANGSSTIATFFCPKAGRQLSGLALMGFAVAAEKERETEKENAGEEETDEET